MLELDWYLLSTTLASTIVSGAAEQIKSTLDDMFDVSLFSVTNCWWHVRLQVEANHRTLDPSFIFIMDLGHSIIQRNGILVTKKDVLKVHTDCLNGRGWNVFN